MAKTTRFSSILSLFAQPAPVTQSVGAIDASLSDTFLITSSSSFTMSFSNFTTGKAIIVAVQNTSGSNITVSFPAIIKDASFTGTIAGSKRSVYTFVSIGGSIYASVIPDMA